MKKRLTPVIIGATALLSFQLLGFQTDHQPEKEKIASEMKRSMVDELLKPWYPKSVDAQYGGFLSTFDFEFKPQGAQDKMIVTQARHIWSNAKAAELFPNVAYYKTDAIHGYHFLRDVMWDKQYGGFYTLVNRQGDVKKGGFAPKEAYGNSFALYGLAAYYEATGDTSALNLAKREFMWLEKHSHDPIHKGYYQHMERDGTPIVRGPNVPSTAELGYKDQNTSIHLLESFTQLYEVWPYALVKKRLAEMLYLIRDREITSKGYLQLFFKPDWTPLSFRDSSEAVIRKHHNLDHVSFGHDIETAYLMLEASHTLGLKNDVVTLRISKKMLDHALNNGWDDKVGGFYDEGYYFKNKPGITIIADSKNWWAQAESMNTLLLFSDLYPNDPHHYYDKFKKQWQYIQTYLIDHEHGDWYQGGLDKEPRWKNELKGQIWKGTYHVLRALINCTERLEKDHTSPTVPSHIILKENQGKQLLTWQPAKDNRGMLGYNIYKNGSKIGFTPLTQWQLPEHINRNVVTVKAVDLQGNESAAGKAM